MLRADDRPRTGDLNLGKVALYQLSYIRRLLIILSEWVNMTFSGIVHLLGIIGAKINAKHEETIFKASD